MTYFHVILSVEKVNHSIASNHPTTKSGPKKFYLNIFVCDIVYLYVCHFLSNNTHLKNSKLGKSNCV